LHCGDPVAGLRCAEEALVLSQGAGSVIGEGLAECTIGKALAAQTGRGEEACAHVMKGIGILEGIGAQYDLARAVLTEAQVRTMCGDPAAAATAEKAGALLHDCGLTKEHSVARALIAQLKAE